MVSRERACWMRSPSENDVESQGHWGRRWPKLVRTVGVDLGEGVGEVVGRGSALANHRAINRAGGLRSAHQCDRPPVRPAPRAQRLGRRHRPTATGRTS